MLNRVAVIVILACCGLTVGCPKAKEESVGGAPKRQLDEVQQRLDKAAKDAAERLNTAGEVGQ
jgi:hypothetical protein